VLEENGSLWYRVLIARYGEEKGTYVMVEEGDQFGIISIGSKRGLV